MNSSSSKIISINEGRHRNDAPKQQSPAKPRKRLDYRRPVVIVVCIVVMTWSVISVISQQIKLSQIRADEKIYKAQIEKLKSDIEELKKEKAQSQSTEYVEKVAREKLKMVKPNEVIYFINKDVPGDGIKSEIKR